MIYRRSIRELLTLFLICERSVDTVVVDLVEIYERSVDCVYCGRARRDLLLS